MKSKLFVLSALLMIAPCLSYAKMVEISCNAYNITDSNPMANPMELKIGINMADQIGEFKLPIDNDTTQIQIIRAKVTPPLLGKVIITSTEPDYPISAVYYDCPNSKNNKDVLTDHIKNSQFVPADKKKEAIEMLEGIFKDITLNGILSLPYAEVLLSCDQIL
jgi:hypothetical protein